MRQIAMESVKALLAFDLFLHESIDLLRQSCQCLVTYPKSQAHLTSITKFFSIHSHDSVLIRYLMDPYYKFE